MDASRRVAVLRVRAHGDETSQSQLVNDIPRCCWQFFARRSRDFRARANFVPTSRGNFHDIFIASMERTRFRPASRLGILNFRREFVRRDDRPVETERNCFLALRDNRGQRPAGWFLFFNLFPLTRRKCIVYEIFFLSLSLSPSLPPLSLSIGISTKG